MKLREFLERLNDMVKERPELEELDVITSIDDEGNAFNLVNYSPTVGNYNDDNEFEQEYPDCEFEINAVCVN